MTFHPTQYNRERSYQNALSSGVITPGDERLIKEYITERKIHKGISERRADTVFNNVFLGIY